MTFRGRRVLIVGLAKSGLSAARLVASTGARVTLCDEKPRRELVSSLRKVPRGAATRLGTRRIPWKGQDLVVVSPGVPWDHPDLVRARKAGVDVWPELELGWRAVSPRATVAVTGTNGKTTTTALIGHLLAAARRRVVVGGNIGTPLTDLARSIDSSTDLVLEVSSYQLEGHATFHPNVGVYLNLTPDHLKRHGTMAGYARAKAALFRHFTARDTAVLNRKDRWCRALGKNLRCRVVWFPSPALRRFSRHLALPGEHNQENGMAAAAAALALGVPERALRRALKTFRGVPHRIQPIAEKAGVLYVNDSKSTNVDSTKVALKAFNRPTRLILGGQHKGASYAPLIPSIRKNVVEILAIGEAADLIRKDLSKAAAVVSCGTLAQAVRRSVLTAKRGDVVLLSPACASFDQFRNFEHRGNAFVMLVRKALR